MHVYKMLTHHNKQGLPCLLISIYFAYSFQKWSECLCNKCKRLEKKIAMKIKQQRIMERD
jgi:hypothetical protein